MPNKEKTQLAPRIYTIGHSTRSITEFISVLKKHKIKLVADVRKIPKSRHNPQFESERLQRALEKENISYRLFKGLAGRRSPIKNSKNNAWRNNSFKGYADHMQTEEFKNELTKLINQSKRKRLAIMCAEAVPWRCHRSLIADALLAKKIAVSDLFSENSAKPHNLPPFAKVRGNCITYPATTSKAAN